MTTNNTEAKRYNMTTDKYDHPTPYETEHGRWVEYSSYKTLQDEYRTLESELATVKKVAYGNVELMGQVEVLQAEYEEELFCVRQTRDTHFGELMRTLEQVDALKGECAILVEALELISDTDPDEGTAWFHEIANKALTTYRKGGCK